MNNIIVIEKWRSTNRGYTEKRVIVYVDGSFVGESEVKSHLDTSQMVLEVLQDAELFEVDDTRTESGLRKDYLAFLELRRNLDSYDVHHFEVRKRDL